MPRWLGVSEHVRSAEYALNVCNGTRTPRQCRTQGRTSAKMCTTARVSDSFNKYNRAIGSVTCLCEPPGACNQGRISRRSISGLQSVPHWICWQCSKTFASMQTTQMPQMGWECVSVYRDWRIFRLCSINMNGWSMICTCTYIYLCRKFTSTLAAPLPLSMCLSTGWLHTDIWDQYESPALLSLKPWLAAFLSLYEVDEWHPSFAFVPGVLVMVQPCLTIAETDQWHIEDPDRTLTWPMSVWMPELWRSGSSAIF